MSTNSETRESTSRSASLATKCAHSKEDFERGVQSTPLFELKGGRYSVSCERRRALGILG